MTSDPETASVALQLLAMSSENAFDRFVKSLPPECRHEAEETIRLRDEMLRHTTLALTEKTHEAMSHAQWLTTNASEVAYRWAVLRDAVERWHLRDFPPLVIRVGR